MTKFKINDIIKSLKSSYGRDFLDNITMQLHTAIGAQYTFIARINKERYVSQTISMVAGDDFGENFEYSLQHTPCADVSDDNTCIYPNQIYDLFPNDQLLIDMEIEGYVGSPLHSSKGEVFGLVVALYSEEIQNADEVAGLFELFAGRIAAELERCENEEESKNANLRLTEATKAGRVAIWDWDIKQDLLVWDPLMFEIYGITKSDDLNQLSLWKDALHIEDKASAIKAFHDAVNGLSDYDIEFRIRRPCGEVRHIKAAATIQRNEAGEALRMVGTNLDVTESRRFEDKIKNLEKRNRALLDYSPACHKIVDLDFKLRYMNLNGFKMLSLPVNEDWYGQPYPFEFFPADTKRLMEEKLHHVMLTKEHLTFESIAHDIKGNEVWLLVNIIPVFKNNSQDLDYLTVVSGDITQQKHTQEQLRHREKMDAIGQLAGGVAHDFNNQLAGISGYAELLQMEVSSKRAKDYLSKIIASTKRSSDLTRQLLNYSRKHKQKSESVDVHGELDDTIELLKHSVDKRIDIQKCFGARQCAIKGDSSNLQNAFLNIGINAADAMQAGGLLKVSTEIVRKMGEERLSKQISATAAEYCKIVFEDNGSGIAKVHLQKVFEPFFTTKEVGKGTGMGLASVYGIVNQHQGFCDIESELGTGTRVYIYLPVCEDVASKTDVNDESLLNQVTNGKTVLVVDDEEVLRELCRDLLTTCGYHVILATNGEEGVELYRELRSDIDVVLMDLTMPVMNGYDASRALIAIDKDAKIIIASGYDSGSSSDKLKSSEISAFIEKPYRLDELKEVIARVTS